MRYKKAVRYIALDYDDTFGAYPELFTGLIKEAKDQGIIPIIVTARSNVDLFFHQTDIIPDAIKHGVGIVFCHWLPKRNVMRYFNKDVVIWIDDTPEAIGEDPEYPYEKKRYDPFFEDGRIAFYSAEGVKALATKQKENE